jgi:hypothetical protein
MGAKEFFERVVKAGYYEAMKSIKRDFQGVPMVIAWQAVLPTEFDQAPHLREKLGDAFYADWFGETQRVLRGYVNDEWYFIDANAYMFAHPDVNTGTHEGDAGQDVLARYMADRLTPVVKHLRNLHCS